jgi:hypothetical protein
MHTFLRVMFEAALDYGVAEDMQRELMLQWTSGSSGTFVPRYHHVSTEMRERINRSTFSSEMWMSRGQYCDFVPQAVMFNARLLMRRTLVAKVPLGAPWRFIQTDILSYIAAGLHCLVYRHMVVLEKGYIRTIVIA